MADDLSKPRERLIIKLTPKTDGAQEEEELPLVLYILGEFNPKPEETSLHKRVAQEIHKQNFNASLKDYNIELEIDVPNHLTDLDDETLKVSLTIESLDDFGPDLIIQKVDELQSLWQRRQALAALKGALKEAAFRRHLDSMIQDEARRKDLHDALRS